MTAISYKVALHGLGTTDPGILWPNGHEPISQDCLGLFSRSSFSGYTSPPACTPWNPGVAKGSCLLRGEWWTGAWMYRLGCPLTSGTLTEPTGIWGLCAGSLPTAAFPRRTSRTVLNSDWPSQSLERYALRWSSCPHPAEAVYHNAKDFAVLISGSSAPAWWPATHPGAHQVLNKLFWVNEYSVCLSYQMLGDTGCSTGTKLISWPR